MGIDVNNIKFWRINEFIHEYTVPGLHSFLSEHENEIEKEVNEFANGEFTGAHNFPTNNNNLNNFITSICKFILSKYYLVGEQYSDLSVAIYTQSKDHNQELYHTHRSKSLGSASLTSTTYLNPPPKEEGGGISFYLHDNDRPIIQPEIDKIYFFPGWVLHTPLPQSSLINRYCFNWVYQCNMRPIHKLTADIW